MLAHLLAQNCTLDRNCMLNRNCMLDRNFSLTRIGIWVHARSKCNSSVIPFFPQLAKISRVSPLNARNTHVSPPTSTRRHFLAFISLPFDPPLTNQNACSLARNCMLTRNGIRAYARLKWNSSIPPSSFQHLAKSLNSLSDLRYGFAMISNTQNQPIKETKSSLATQQQTIKIKQWNKLIYHEKEQK